MCNYYVYRHIRLDTGLPFYIGKGKGKRAWNKNRNAYWKNIVKKHGYRVELMLSDLNEKQAFKKEIEFINLYKSSGLCEANLTDGGEGSSGRITSNETRQKMSKSQTGKVKSEEACKKLSESLTGRFISPVHRFRIGESNKGRSSVRKGVKCSDITKFRMSKSQTGKTRSYVVKEAQSKRQTIPIKFKAIKGDFTKIYENVVDCSKDLGLIKSNVWKCLKGIRNRCGGYAFEVLKEE